MKHNGGYDPKDRAAYLRLLKEAERLNKRLMSALSGYRMKSGEDVCHVNVKITRSMALTIKKLIEVLNKIGRWSMLPGAVGGNTAEPLREKLSAFLSHDISMVWISYDMGK